jgi:hypothetical protein
VVYQLHYKNRSNSIFALFCVQFLYECLDETHVEIVLGEGIEAPEK